MAGTLTYIIIGAEAGKQLGSVSAVRAVEGRGLEGDRYYEGKGSFNRPPLDQSCREVSLISFESVAICNERLGTALGPEDFRRNIVIDGIDLRLLRGKCFRIGTAVFKYARTAPPCRYLSRLVDEDMMQGLKGLGGIRANIIQSGVLCVGDRLEVVEERR